MFEIFVYVTAMGLIKQPFRRSKGRFCVALFNVVLEAECLGTAGSFLGSIWKSTTCFDP